MENTDIYLTNQSADLQAFRFINDLKTSPGNVTIITGFSSLDIWRLSLQNKQLQKKNKITMLLGFKK